jgi:DNA-binding winged helix-turn-helix (wHTH) protein
METIPPTRAHFGVFDLDFKTGELHRGKRRTLLQEQPFRILMMLLERAGDVATREEIRNRLWPDDTIVEFDQGINRAIRKLRRALGDSAENPRYIETVARRGYRLLPAVEWKSRVEPILGGTDRGAPHQQTMCPFRRIPRSAPLLRSGDRLYITVQFSRARSNGHVWEDGCQGRIYEFLAPEGDFPHDIPVQMQVQLTSEIQAQLGFRRPVGPEVMRAYLQGNYHLRKYSRNSGDEEKKKAAEYFLEAIDGDPKFAPAYDGLSQAHQDLLFGSSKDAVIARTAAEKAVELAPAYSEARVSLAITKWKPDLDLQGTDTEFRRAIALNYHNARAHRSFGIFLNEIGHVEEGLRECQIAQQLSPGNVAWLPYSLFYCRDYDAAITTAQMMLLRDPDDAFLHVSLYSAYAKKGMYKESVE